MGLSDMKIQFGIEIDTVHLRPIFLIIYLHVLLLYTERDY